MLAVVEIIPVFITFAVTVALGPVLIPFLLKLKVGQTERELGVEAHKKKAGTPTMGGIMFLAAITLTGMFYIFRYPRIGPVLFLTLSYGLLGFADDYLKVVKRRSDGLYPRQKFLLELVIIFVFGVYLSRFTDISMNLRIPFSGGREVDIGIFKWPLMVLAIGGTVNGVNFTDGVDGLAASVTAVAAVFFTIASIMLDGGITPMGTAVLGSLLGFLVYNAYPAKVFMGDTGSLALGGFVIGMAYMLGMPLYIPLIGLVYLVEVLSVILQVGYFKMTHGKRIFKMAPIHHHFELSGWSETRVVANFTVAAILLAIAGLLAI
ncbi:MAG: phospho-N-acetylmuramoyl-pentapeptide-transferase [Lachnospiraceae bacterium]|nr:phospho-N-acetylmuramoyl-pentapeptide-transferase [Lachnospiraceae bacterium]